MADPQEEGLLAQAHAYLDGEAVTERYSHHVIDRVRRLALRTDGSEKQQLETELKVLLAEVLLEDRADRDLGAPPRHEPLSDEEIAYVERRLASTSSCYMKLRYASALWTLGKKHSDLGEAFVDACLELLDRYKDLDAQRPDEHWGLRFAGTMKLSHRASRKFGYRLDEARVRVMDALLAYPSSTSSLLVIRIDAAELVLDGKYGEPAYEQVKHLGLNWGPQLVAEGREFNAIQHVYRVGRAADAKLGLGTEVWERLTAEAYEHMARRRSDSMNVAADFIWSASLHFKKAGDLAEAERLQEEHSAMKTQREFKHFQSQIDISALVDEFRQFAEALVEEGVEAYYSALVYDPRLVPDWSATVSEAEKLRQQHPLSTLCPTEVIDHRGNRSAMYGGDAGGVRYSQLQNMKIRIDFKTMQIRELFAIGSQRGLFTVDVVTDILMRSTWLGHRFDPDGTPNRSGALCWAEVLLPGVVRLIEVVHRFAGVTSYGATDVLCAVDSVVLKFEGVLRQYLQCHGCTVTKKSRSRHGAEVQREMDINDLLDHERIREDFGESNTEFLRFILIEHAGWNLRHHVAHAMLPAAAYNLNHVLMLLLGVFRLAALSPPYGPTSAEPVHVEVATEEGSEA